MNRKQRDERWVEVYLNLAKRKLILDTDAESEMIDAALCILQARVASIPPGMNPGKNLAVDTKRRLVRESFDIAQLFLEERVRRKDLVEDAITQKEEEVEA